MNWDEIPQARGEADFGNLLAVLRRDTPSRPTLFEFFLNERLYARILQDMPGDPILATGMESPQGRIEAMITASHRLGYDYTTLVIPKFSFSSGLVQRTKDRSVSMNEGAVIHNRTDFNAFPWPDPDDADYEILKRLEKTTPKGMKLIPYGPNGVLENVVDLVGYEDICVMIHDDPKLAADIFGEVGSRLARYYERALAYDIVGACISNDDWGFKTQTMFSPRDMRKFVFPWHKRIVETIHAGGRPAILHSCGYFQRILDDVIDDLKIDGRHSYEDTIMPVEEFYECYHDRIAVLGGIDLDFVCRSSPEEVYQRASAMLDRAAARGGYALGTGNSVPDYVPDQNFFAMIRAALDRR
jgi:uroporphyrinogen decarboxylase